MSHTIEHHDPADSNEASYWPEYEDAPADVWADTWLTACRVLGVVVAAQAVEAGKDAVRNILRESDASVIRQAQREAVVRFMLQARAASACPDLAYFVACWQAAFELDDGESQTAIAAQFNKTRAAVSKRVVEIRSALGGTQVARGQKSREAANTYKLRQLIVGQSRRAADLTQNQKETNTLWNS